ncbi:hypothetical protein SAMN02746062_01212 [Alysiella filiformis DSM 16848]|uniref:Uncharacterized protein n=2 Tax=Alysiella TaxID=194195 RepID=A0A286EBP7_9NEIS|nr:hypothetical protein SAMN02746062_01212 [Alysiella filiformis DSM 16848]
MKNDNQATKQPSNQATKQPSNQSIHDLIDHIPYTLRTQINQIDPRIDVFWQDHLLDLFKAMSAQERQNVAKQILAPKRIAWNAEQKIFEYHHNQADNLEQAIAQVPANAKRMKAFALKLPDHLNALKTMDDVVKIAEFLENLIGQIHKQDVQDSVQLQRAKQRLLTEFIYAAADIIKQKKEFLIPKTVRGLNLPIIKTFINEVYLKHQLLGYWFKTLRNRQLADMPHEVLNQFLRQEQRIRQLEVVRASKYLFSIAPSLEYAVNPFTIRRFLLEERLFGGSVLLNGVALNTAMLANCDDIYIAKFKKQIDLVITIEASVSRAIIDFFAEIEQYHDDVLLPMLFEPFKSVQNIDVAVAERLKQYEKLLTQRILEPMTQAVSKMAKNNDECEYLYVGMRQLFGSIVQSFQDFQTLPAVLGNETATTLFAQLVAYASFLEKRRTEVFVHQSEVDWANHHNRAQEGLNKVRDWVNKQIKPYRDLVKQVAAQQELMEKPVGFIGKMLHTKEKQQEKLDELKKEMRQTAWGVHQNIFHMPKDFKEQMVHLEFDSLLITNEMQRNYAYPAGNNGMTRLPVVLTLPENRTEFDLSAFANELHNRLAAAN